MLIQFEERDLGRLEVHFPIVDNIFDDKLRIFLSYPLFFFLYLSVFPFAGHYLTIRLLQNHPKRIFYSVLFTLKKEHPT